MSMSLPSFSLSSQQVHSGDPTNCQVCKTQPMIVVPAIILDKPRVAKAIVLEKRVKISSPLILFLHENARLPKEQKKKRSEWKQVRKEYEKKYQDYKYEQWGKHLTLNWRAITVLKEDDPRLKQALMSVPCGERALVWYRLQNWRWYKDKYGSKKADTVDPVLASQIRSEKEPEQDIYPPLPDYIKEGADVISPEDLVRDTERALSELRREQNWDFVPNARRSFIPEQPQPCQTPLTQPRQRRPQGRPKLTSEQQEKKKARVKMQRRLKYLEPFMHESGFKEEYDAICEFQNKPRQVVMSEAKRVVLRLYNIKSREKGTPKWSIPDSSESFLLESRLRGVLWVCDIKMPRTITGVFRLFGLE